MRIDYVEKVDFEEFDVVLVLRIFFVSWDIFVEKFVEIFVGSFIGVYIFCWFLNFFEIERNREDYIDNRKREREMKEL